MPTWHITTEALKRAHTALMHQADREEADVERWGPTVAAAIEAERGANRTAAANIQDAIEARERREWTETVNYLSGSSD
jgi:hypothetical protein